MLSLLRATKVVCFLRPNDISTANCDFGGLPYSTLDWSVWIVKCALPRVGKWVHCTCTPTIALPTGVFGGLVILHWLRRVLAELAIIAEQVCWRHRGADAAILAGSVGVRVLDWGLPLVREWIKRGGPATGALPVHSCNVFCKGVGLNSAVTLGRQGEHAPEVRIGPAAFVCRKTERLTICFFL
jgi:hypothetical protein